MLIQINLLPGAKRKRGGGAGFQLPDFKELLTQVKEPLLLGAIASCVLGFSAVGGIWVMEKDKTASLEPELNRFRQEARQFRDLIEERNRQQDLRDSLVVSLEALRAIDGDRFVWPHIMDEVSRALPDFTWIVSLDALAVPDELSADGTPVAPPVRFSLDGRTSDLQGFTRFLSQLEESPWLRDIRAGGTQTVIESDQPVTSFEVTATFTLADSSHILTVPLIQGSREDN
jgi:Tfp pilus assembly protein PilN